jgi:NMD protein affecting ribosome stability and mRNA decay
MEHPTTTQALSLETLARETQRAVPCAHCARRPAVVLDYLCAECDAPEASPATVPWTPAEGTTTCRACGLGEPLADGMCGECIADVSAAVDERRAVWFPGQ